jgi:hypothetical protein
MLDRSAWLLHNFYFRGGQKNLLSLTVNFAFDYHQETATLHGHRHSEMVQ